MVEISNRNPCQSDQAEFKDKFANSLPCKLKQNGFKVVLFWGDADTSIVKTALDIHGRLVTVLPDDIDIFYHLLHYVYFTSKNKDSFSKIIGCVVMFLILQTNLI